jgi:hypothetical protein
MGSTTAALWAILGKAANLAQMSGLHAVMLVAVGATLLCFPQSNRECAELERCERRLRALLQWPVTGCGLEVLCSPEMGGAVSKALGDAAGLVESYKKSTLWCRVRRGRSMARQLRDSDMQDVVNSCYVLVLFLKANLLILQPTTHPTSDPTMYVKTNSTIYTYPSFRCSLICLWYYHV